MTRAKTAWLITWEWTGDHAKPDQKIVSVQSSRLSPERVRDYVERLYASMRYTPCEKLAYAVAPRKNLYRAQFDSVGGVPWQSRITCGHNPWLYARLVMDIRLVDALDGPGRLDWKEIPPPKPPSL